MKTVIITHVMPEPVRKKVLFKECAVAGVSFHLKYDDELWDELEEGTKVALVREKKNKFDKNAVAIALADDYDGDPENFDFDFILGYIPHTENEQIAQMLDMGWDDVFVAELSAVDHNGPINDRLRISIYIQSKEPVVDHSDQVRLKWISDDDLEEIETELTTRGFAYFRWGGFPPENHEVYEVGETILFLHSRGSMVCAYLMRVFAEGDDCAQWLAPEEVYAVDDRACYILTNVMGPVIFEDSEIDFIPRQNDEYYFGPGKWLGLDESQRIKSILRHQIIRQLNKNNIDMDPSIDEPY
ncbi:MAG: HIRAN domain-containing protein [Bacteroides sp.]|nr:HIRAN domain-containing protein [Bacteroides sp.]